jgi:pimeloyl-ACP methyl ester carboxylesterase
MAHSKRPVVRDAMAQVPAQGHKRRTASGLFARFAVMFCLAGIAPAFVAPARAPVPLSVQVLVLNSAGLPITAFTDGDNIGLQVTLPEPVNHPEPVRFTLAGDGPMIGGCTVALWQRRCASNLVRTLGWAWDPLGRRALPVVQAWVGPARVAASPPLQVAARPVVMVHGINSSWVAWTNYVGPNGYLAGIGLAGYAVGDGQVPGVMNTGSALDPAARTNTIAEDAAILGGYIANVKRATGAQMVDVVAHSLGGLITRYYIDRVMGPRDVAQLIMLGTPQAGSECAVLPSALGFLMPATLEIRPSYMTGIFNPQITHRRGVPFHAVAGTAFQSPVGSPCTGVPNDLVVSLESASAIPSQLEQISLSHVDLNNSADLFERFVRPLLQASAGSFGDEPDPPASASITPAALQFTRVFTGHVDAGGSQSVTIQIEAGLAVASFGLYDVTRSLTVTVVGGSGQTIALNPQDNGLVVVDDPSTLVYMGYGFDNPQPGAWVTTLRTTGRTPAAGADYAITANLQGGATVSAQASPLTPAVGQDVALRAQLILAGQSLQLDQAQAIIRRPDGGTQTVSLTVAGAQATGRWRPTGQGVFGIDLTVNGRAPDGTTVERSAFLAIDAQPPHTPARTYAILIIICGVLSAVAGLAGGGAFALLRRRRRRGK